MKNYYKQKKITMKKIIEQIKKYSDKKHIEFSKKLIKTKNKFYGVKTPVLRKIAKDFLLDAKEENIIITAENLYSSDYQELRMTAIFIMEYCKIDNDKKWEICDKWINKIDSWDICDTISTAVFGKIVLRDKSKVNDLYKWIKSENFWRRRVGVVSTIWLAKKDDYNITFDICEKLILDNEMYIQKAVGWLLREAGKRNQNKLKNILFKWKDKIPRITLSYAIEKHRKWKELFIKKY